MNKSGFVSVFGKPNAGKSTLVNALLNFNLSIVNKKVQTTRDKILGILTEKNYQIVFTDTPGILEPKYELQKFMLSEIKSSLDEADIVIHIADITNMNFDDISKVQEGYRELLDGKVKIMVLNKIDLVNKDSILPVMDKISKSGYYDDIVPVSASRYENIELLKEVIVRHLPEGEFFYETDTLTDKPEKFFAAEIIREKILSLYHEEIPYSVFVGITEFKERSSKLVYINAEIILERESQKIILIGKGGQGLKRLGEKARKDIENFLHKKVFLELFVKVRKDWRNNKKFMKEIYSNKSRS